MQPLNCVSLLLLLSVLLAALSPVVATARREIVIAATGDGGPDQPGRAASTLSDAPEAAAKDDAEGVIGSRRKKDKGVNCRFRTRKMPSQLQFGGRMPFTADYHSVHRHPPKHN